MGVLPFVLYLLATICFLVAAGGLAATLAASRLNLVALGLFFWVLVPLIAAVQALGH